MPWSLYTWACSWHLMEMPQRLLLGSHGQHSKAIGVLHINGASLSPQQCHSSSHASLGYWGRRLGSFVLCCQRVNKQGKLQSFFYAFPVLFSTTSEPCEFMEVLESSTKVVESLCSWPTFAKWSSYQRQWGNVSTRPQTSLCIIHAFNILRHRSLETCFPSPLWRPLEISACHWSTYNFKFPTAVYDSVEWRYPIYIVGLHGQMELPWCVACAVGLIVQQICSNQKSPYLREPLELWWSALLYIFLIWASGLLLPPDNFFWKNLEER